MKEDEYDLFLEDPTDYTLRFLLPRAYTNLAPLAGLPSLPDKLFGFQMLLPLLTTPQFREMASRLLKAGEEQDKWRREYGDIEGILAELGFPPHGVMGGAGGAPFDMISDFYRGMKGAMLDMYRQQDNILEACDRILKNMLDRIPQATPGKINAVAIPTHRGSEGFMSLKQFEKLYWPYLLKIVNALDKEGQPCQLFCENNWMRYLDYLYELPPYTRICFEYGDPTVIKEKLGKKHIISGLYPIAFLKTATKQQCIDKAKELIDIMAPGGNYIFQFDKNPLLTSDINLENYTAVLRYVAENAYYDNPGDNVFMAKEINSSNTEDKIPPFRSKYYKTDSKYSEKFISSKLQSYEEMVFAFISMMLL
jgi:hypothetical protein